MNSNKSKNMNKKKLSFDQYNGFNEQGSSSSGTAGSSGNNNRDNESKTGKIKATYYLTPKANKMLTNVYIKRLQDDKKTDKSALICEAIELLFNKEMK